MNQVKQNHDQALALSKATLVQAQCLFVFSCFPLLMLVLWLVLASQHGGLIACPPLG